MTLTGYAVELNGSVFTPNSGGVIKFSARSGACLRIKITAPPHFSEDPSGEALGLVGLELEKLCP